MYEWKVCQPNIVESTKKPNPAEEALNILEEDGWEIVNTMVLWNPDGYDSLTIVARKKKKKSVYEDRGLRSTSD